MKYLGKLASQHAKKYLKPGEKVVVEVLGRGFYGRPLAFIYLPDGRNFNYLMVRDGYACIYNYKGKKSDEIPEKDWKELIRLLKQAKIEKKGERLL